MAPPRWCSPADATATACWRRSVRQPARDAIDWSRLDLWWGDERFLPEGDPERNVTQAREALLDRVPLDPARVHAMPASDGPYGSDVDAAAAAYAEELAAAAGPGDHGGVPTFDVLMLGVGPDTHVASLFPELPAVRETERTVVGVHGAPKPPPVRVSLTLPAIRAAKEVWLLTAGADKAKAAAIALSGAGEVQAPAAGAYGRSRTLWLLDAAAASELPRSLYPLGVCLTRRRGGQFTPRWTGPPASVRVRGRASAGPVRPRRRRSGPGSGPRRGCRTRPLRPPWWR